MTRQGQSEDALSAMAPLDQQSGIGKRLELSHVLSTSCQSMNVCIHNGEGVVLYDYSCEDEECDFGTGCGSNGRRQMRPSLLVLSISMRHKCVNTHINCPVYVCVNRHISISVRAAEE